MKEWKNTMKVVARTSVFLAVLCFALNWPESASAASFTIDQVMSAPFASSLIASPIGAKVAWLLNEQGRRNVWVAEAPDWKGHKLTSFNQDDGQEIAELAWAP